MNDVKDTENTAALSSWTPAQQWMPKGSRTPMHGYDSAPGILVLADELADKLSEAGRASVIDRCFENSNDDATSTLPWAICGNDVKALDLKKLDAELAADGIKAKERKGIVEQAEKIQQGAQKIGDAVEAAAKDDPGVAAVLKLGEQARAEWSAYLAKNKDAFARYLALKDGVRSGKSNHPNFAGCWEQTQPPFAKLVKATTFPPEVEREYMPTYMAAMLTSTENYITVASWAACAYSIHESGTALFAAVSNHPGGVYRVGPRSLTLAKAMDPNFKPKFAQRSLSIDSMRGKYEREQIRFEGINGVVAIQTPTHGTIAKVKQEGDVTKISFKGDKVERCLQWKETNKVTGIGAGGRPTYDKVCLKRGDVDNQEGDEEIATKYAAGLTPGLYVVIVHGFPVAAWKGEKYIAMFGVVRR